MSSIRELSIDLETYSDIDIKKAGAYKYAESDSFEILLSGISVNDDPVIVYDIACGDKIPEQIIDAILDDTVVKRAYNASFERVCLSHWIRRFYPDKFHGYIAGDGTDTGFLNPASWRCTMVWAAYMGLPLSLEGAGAVLGLDSQKMKEGKELIRYFCGPCAPTKSNGGRTRNLPCHAPEKWNLFKKYNARDVEVELAIKEKLRNFPVPDFIWDEYRLDQEINDRGIMVDMPFVENAIRFSELSKEDLSHQIQSCTNIENPNSVVQMKKWLADNGIEAESLGKKDVAEMIKTAPEDLAKVLSLRQMLAKSSVKKYEAMRNSVCADSREHGMFMFYGANRTGRWAGRIVQLQNLPQNKMPDLSEARQIVRDGDYETMSILYDNIPDTLSQLIRTAFIPRPGYRFCVADFSAIEARVLAHLAGETWRSEVFRNGGDIYCASASQMFRVPVEKHGINGHLRQKGKIAELALGYGGSKGALVAMGALEMGLEEVELLPLVQAWRNSNPRIVSLWWAVDEAAKAAVRLHTVTETHGIGFMWKSGMLFIQLPSGRRLCYVKPRIGENRFGGESVTYEGIGATKKWERLESYGPKFCENLVQAISRDILMNSIRSLRNTRIVAHVHDELIIECRDDVSLESLCESMAHPPEWMPDILLRADGYITDFYRKD